MAVPTPAEALKRYKRFMTAAQPEHDRVLAEVAKYYQGYGLNSIQGRDFAELGTLWGDNPPEVGVMLANVDTFWGSLIGARHEPTFPALSQVGSTPQGLKREAVGELLTMLVKAGRRWAGSDAVDEGAVMDLIIVGMAFAELNLETEQRPPFRPKEKHVRFDQIWWDPGHTEKNMKDGQEYVRRWQFGIDEAAARFPEAADAIRAMGIEASAGGKDGAPGAGARALGGATVAVSVTSTDGGDVKTGDTQRRRLREVPVDDYQFIHFEELLSWGVAGENGQAMRMENTPEVFDAWSKAMGRQAQSAGQGYRPPPVLRYPCATWYRCKILARNIGGEPLVLSDPEPIPGNQRLVRAMTAKGEYVLSGETLKRRWFGWGRVLFGLQRLLSVAIRIEIEQEARRNRGSADVESDAFDSEVEFQAYVESRRIPGAVAKIKPGAFEKIHERQENLGTRVASMRELFAFFAMDLPKYVLGISDMNRGTFTGDRSSKFLDTMLQSSLQMQTQFTSAFTDYLDEGAVTMARLMLGPKGLDGADIDEILGSVGAPLREGITGQKDPQSGELVPINDPATDEPMTEGGWLKANLPDILEHDVAFGLRPSAPSERAANSQLMLQHGVFKDMLDAGAPADIIVPAILRASFEQGTEFADLAAKLETYYAGQKQQQDQQAQAQTEDGWVQFIAQMASQDQGKAGELMQKASEAVLGPAGKQTPPGAQGGPAAGPGGVKPPSMTVNYKDVGPEAKAAMLALDGIQIDPQALAASDLEMEARKAELKAATRSLSLPPPVLPPQGGMP